MMLGTFGLPFLAMMTHFQWCQTFFLGPRPPPPYPGCGIPVPHPPCRRRKLRSWTSSQAEMKTASVFINEKKDVRLFVQVRTWLVLPLILSYPKMSLSSSFVYHRTTDDTRLIGWAVVWALAQIGTRDKRSRWVGGILCSVDFPMSSIELLREPW